MFYSRDPLGTSDAFADELVDLQPRLLGFARTLAFDVDEAEELVQETLVRALAARDRYRAGTNMRAWLFTILRNVHLNRRRAQLRRSRELGLDGVEEQAAVTPAADDQVVARSEAADVLQALRRLPPAFAAPLRLLAVEELTYAEIAAVLEVPVGTVMSRIYRARRMLAGWLETS